MILEKYWEILRKINKLYYAEKYVEILDFLESTEREYPYGKAALFYTGICAATKLGNLEKALVLLRSVINDGGWYSEVILTQSPSLQPLQDLEEFKILLKRSLKSYKEGIRKNQDITIFPKDGTSPYPLVLALHADSGILEEEIIYQPETIDNQVVI